MTQISLTVPSDDERALVAAGTFFLTLAGKVPALELDDAPEAAFKDIMDTPPEFNQDNRAWDPGYYSKENAPEATQGPTITTIDTVRVAESIKEKLPDAFLKLDESGEWMDPTAEPTEEDTGAVGDLDANDLPWDPRIHASSKVLNKDNTWRYKRGVDKDVVATVEAELKGLLSAPAQETAPPPPPPPPPVQETTAPPPPVEGMTVPAFLQLVTANIAAKKWTREEIEQAIVNQGVPGVDKIPHLMAHKDLIPKVLEELNA